MMWKSQAVQHPEELDTFVECVRVLAHRRSYLEIGAKFGGTFWAMASALEPGARMVAVDLPGATKAWAQSKPALESAVADLRLRGFDAWVIWGESTSSTTIDFVRRFGPYDVILIDANHTLPYLQQDWNNYHPLGRVIAFHDICWSRPLEGWPKGHPRIDVPEFWNELKQQYRHIEIKCDPSGRDNGIGMLWL